MKTFKQFVDEAAKLKHHKIDDEDREEFEPHEIEAIKNAPFPDTVRDNLRRKKADKKQKDYINKQIASTKGDGGDSSITHPTGGSSSTDSAF
jgi:hypothetical protein